MRVSLADFPGATAASSRVIFSETAPSVAVVHLASDASAVENWVTSSDTAPFHCRRQGMGARCRSAYVAGSRATGWRGANTSRVAALAEATPRQELLIPGGAPVRIRKTEPDWSRGTGPSPLESVPTHGVGRSGRHSRRSDMGAGGHWCRLHHDAKRIL